VEEIEVLVETEINPTEDLEKVKKAIENIIYNAEFEIKEEKDKSVLIAKAYGLNSLVKLQNLFKTERIRDAARAVLLRGLNEETITFYLNKQVAYVKHISFSEPAAESPLGPIKIQIRCSNPKNVIDWLAPKTRA